MSCALPKELSRMAKGSSIKQLKRGVYLESGYPGVGLGAVVMERGTVLIDAPPRPDDGRAWLASLRGLGSNRGRVLVNLDAHPDRALGARSMESPVMAHEETLAIFQQRPPIFKAQGAESGAEWETLGGLSGLRWLPPSLLFSDSTAIHWGDYPVILEHHPGPQAGAAWAMIPELQVVFIGDAVLHKQPPFLARADIPDWLDTLDVLLREYKRWTIVSSRGGVVPEKAIREQRRYLADVHTKLEALGKKKALPNATEKLVSKLLAASGSPGRLHTQHTHRLRYGLYHYYARHYRRAPAELPQV